MTTLEIILYALIIGFVFWVLKNLFKVGYIQTSHPPGWVVKAAHRKVMWMGQPGEYAKLKVRHYRWKVYPLGNGHYAYYKKRRGH